MVQERLDDLRGCASCSPAATCSRVGAVQTVLREARRTCRLVNGYGPTENTTFTCCFAIPAELGGRHGAHRPPRRQHARLRAGRGAAPRARRRPGRAVRGRRRRGARLPGPARAHGGALRPRSVRRGARRADVPHGRPGALDGGRRARVPGPPGRAGEDPRLPHRAGRGRGRAAPRTPACATACVVVREDAPGDRRLVAYVVGDADADALRAHLRRALPEYMVPVGVRAAGRAAADAQRQAGPRGRSPRRSTADAEERTWRRARRWKRCWRGSGRRCCGVDRVGVEDDFFDLGGHSLLATRVVSRIREVLGVELPLRALFEGPTVAELAERVEEMRRAGAAPRCRPSCRVERDGPAAALVRAGAAVVPGPAAAGERASTTCPRRCGWRGALDAAALERALGEVVRRHEALRTTLRRGGRRARAGDRARSPASRSPWRTCRRWTDGAREAAARAARRGRGGAPVRPGGGPALSRARCCGWATDEHVLLLSMHHIVSDGWSMGVLFRELAALYAAFARGRGVAAAAAAGAVRGLRRVAARAAAGRGAGAAAGVLEGRSWPARPSCWSCPRTARAPPCRRSAARAGLRPAARGRCWSGWRRWRAREGATLYMVLLAAFQVLLSPLQRAADDVVVGTPHRRAHAARDGGADRLLRQHAGAADGPGRRSRRSARSCAACAT